VLGGVGAGMMLPDLVPVAFGHIIESQRSLRHNQLRNQRPRFLTLSLFYFLCFAASRAFRRSMKPLTFNLEVEVPVRRSAVSVLIDGHGTALQV